MQEVSKITTLYPGQEIIVSINVSINREFSEEEMFYFSRTAESISKTLRQNTLLVTEKDEREREKKEIIDLFDCPIFVEEIPNEYSSDYLNPWFIVTTPKGRIKIGWRKRVINIDWSDSPIQHFGLDLFKDENVTFGHKYVHAYGYGKAKEYLSLILN